ncbi:MAG: hypothetical protein WKG07_43280 [Hymenobacter sp.]
MPYYENLGWKFGDFPHAEAYYARCLSLPSTLPSPMRSKATWLTACGSLWRTTRPNIFE